jgi:hypothetical protein
MTNKLDSREENMKTRILQAAIAATVFGTPAFADYFIVREGSSGPCTVIESRPTDTKTVVIGNRAYAARAEAEREIATVCAAAPGVVPAVKECLYQGRAFSDGATNPSGQVCEKGSWR